MISSCILTPADSFDTIFVRNIFMLDCSRENHTHTHTYTKQIIKKEKIIHKGGIYHTERRTLANVANFGFANFSSGFVKGCKQVRRQFLLSQRNFEHVQNFFANLFFRK